MVRASAEKLKRFPNCKLRTLRAVHKGREWPIGDIEAHMKTHMFCCMTYEDFGTLRRSVSIILPRPRKTTSDKKPSLVSLHLQC